jgi:2-polyprenyl-3-methyl-5-hydroxy-6-metoxy-1,4-benzoquinol methylase
MWGGSIDLDKAGKKYWDHIWITAEKSNTINPAEVGLNDYVYRRFHEYFRRIFSNSDTKEKTLLEIGCASSSWLPYFIKAFGFKVYGIDYSDIGCRQAKQALLSEGLEGEVICADLFSPPESMIGAFDIVVSFGVVEHYQDTAGCVEGFSKFLKPGGMLITNTPNLVGLMGMIQKYLNRDVYNIHVPLSPKDLGDAHRRNRLQVISCDYFLVVNLGVLNLENLRKNALLARILRLRSWINKTIWAYERLIPLLKPNRWSSPYINCVAIKKGN